jgi:hypothetical protein
MLECAHMQIDWHLSPTTSRGSTTENESPLALPGMPALNALRYKWLHFAACAMGVLAFLVPGAARGRFPNRGDDCA